MQKKILVLSGLALLNVNPATAVEHYTVNGDNYSYAFDLYKGGEKLRVEDDTTVSAFDLDKQYSIPLVTAAQKWAEVLKTDTSEQPLVKYAILTEDEYNASAVSMSTDIKEYPYQITYVNAVINNKQVVTNEETLNPDDGYIFIGKGISEDAPGWGTYSGLHTLYHGKLPDFHTVLLHEIMHSLGITSNAAQHKEDEGDKTYYFTENKTDKLYVMDKDLRLYTGDDDDDEFDSEKELKPKAGMSVGEDEDFDVIEYSPYYVGKNTLKVLSGKNDYMEARRAIIENGGLTNYSCSYDEKRDYPQVFGLPIHNADDDEIDLSHIELHNSFMSHQEYRNWLIPMEAELAVLQDLGYDIDLREFYGKSYYLNDLTENFTTGYSEWNGSAYTKNPSKVSQGVGLHIYGNNNNITQSADISTIGEGAVGVRIDGIKNKYSLSANSNISTNGKENLGIAVTWGKNHIVNIEKNATVTASGEDGIAVSFDFGDNLFGSLSDVHGSYINYSADIESDVKPLDDTADALVEKFNVAGKLTGSKAAIYISDNAHVKQINILNGAEINGDIISEWNSATSGENAHVLYKTDSGWYPVDDSEEEQLYFTDLNIASDFEGAINGRISGETSDNNTLKLKNAGNVDLNGDEIAVYSFSNKGSVNIKDAELSVQNGAIEGNGTLNVKKELQLDGSVESIENTVNLQSGSLFSTINDKFEEMDIAQLNADNASIAFDLGDEFTLQEPSQYNTAAISQIKINKASAAYLEDDADFTLFGNDNVIDFGNSYANVYYNGNRYHLTQDQENKSLLHAELSGENMTLADAAQDETAASYIVTEKKQTKDIGTVKGPYFEISGRDVDANGHKGIIVDGQHNDGTIIKTGVYGAKGNNLSVKNNGKLAVIAQDDDILLGRTDEKAIYMQDAEVILNAEKYDIEVNGEINGASGYENKITAAGKNIYFQKTNNVNVSVENTNTELKNTSHNTVWNINGGSLKISEDEFLSADATNQLVSNGGALDLENDKASEIALNKLVLNENLNTAIDIDLKSLEADHFVVADNNLIADKRVINVQDVNLLNPHQVLAKKKIAIPFVAEEMHNTNLIGKVNMENDYQITSPIFVYDLGYEEDGQDGAFVLQRGSNSDYGSYNPAVTVAPVAAQLGGYLTQLYSYNQVFDNMDSSMPNIGEATQTAETQSVMPDKLLWLRPYSAFEKVGLKNGPKVRNNMYGTFFGANSQTRKTDNGWDFQYGLYAGYNGSRQRYDGNLIRQNGGTLGLVGYWHKNNFFSALTVNAGADAARATTAYGKENFYALRYGVAAKTGYNWMLFGNRLVIQPNYLMSYTSVSTFNYKNAARVNIKSHPLYALSVAPGIKFAYNFQSGWQPYAGANMVWSLGDKTDFKAQYVEMPEMRVKPYVQYMLGVQKDWNDKFSGYIQTGYRDGGRKGIDAAAGFKWAFN